MYLDAFTPTALRTHLVATSFSRLCAAQRDTMYNIYSALEVIFNVMRYANSRFTYLLTLASYLPWLLSS